MILHNGEYCDLAHCDTVHTFFGYVKKIFDGQEQQSLNLYSARLDYLEEEHHKAELANNASMQALFSERQKAAEVMGPSTPALLKR